MKQDYFCAGLPPPTERLFGLGLYFSMLRASCSRRVFDAERLSATMYSILWVLSEIPLAFSLVLVLLLSFRLCC